MRRRFSYANVAATLALVLSMSGGALAAKHYLINSTKQINPKVLKKLKGKSGPKGLNGLNGAPGATGAQGPAGKEGPPGAAGSAVAYAHILGATKPTEALDGANSKNVSAVTEPFPGGYCISTTVPIKNVAGAGDFNVGGGPGVTVSANFSLVAGTIPVTCPAGTTVLAETGGGGGTESADFWISFN
jgi:hypothetical protein